MTATYEKIATTTLGSAAATVDFTSISGSYTDLVLIGNFGGSLPDESALFRVGNGSIDTGSNYSSTELYGTGSSAASQRNSNETRGRITYALGVGNSVGNNCILHFQNYSNTTTYKTVLGRDNINTGTYTGISAIVSLWRSTSAIDQIRLLLSGGNYLTGSTFTLYGIKAE